MHDGGVGGGGGGGGGGGEHPPNAKGKKGQAGRARARIGCIYASAAASKVKKADAPAFNPARAATK